MMPAANQGVGMNMGFPDVCTTPAAPAPIPIPYPNIGMNAMGMPFVPNVLFSMAPAQNMGTKPTLTNGDNAGVAHPMFMQPGGTIMGNPIVLVGGMPASHLTNPTYGNNFNNPVGTKMVPSVTNVLLGCATAQRPATTFGLLHEERARATIAHGLLVLRVPCITTSCDRWLAHTLRRVAGRLLCGVVLDLRGNPGGVVPVAARMHARLVRLRLPIAVVLDRRTASAAEMLAAALRDDRRGHVRTFGERTFGKGRVQPFRIADGAVQPAGCAREVRRGSGARLDRVGLTPDQHGAGDDAVGMARRWLGSLAEASAR